METPVRVDYYYVPRILFQWPVLVESIVNRYVEYAPFSVKTVYFRPYGYEEIQYMDLDSFKKSFKEYNP